MNTKGAPSKGKDSPYNYIYHYLLDNYSPGDFIPEDLLYKEYKAYCIKWGKVPSNNDIYADIKKAIANFNSNNGSHGDTAHNLGKGHAPDSTFNNIKWTVANLKW